MVLTRACATFSTAHDLLLDAGRLWHSRTISDAVLAIWSRVLALLLVVLEATARLLTFWWSFTCSRSHRLTRTVLLLL